MSASIAAPTEAVALSPPRSKTKAGSLRKPSPLMSAPTTGVNGFPDESRSAVCSVNQPSTDTSPPNWMLCRGTPARPFVGRAGERPEPS